MDTLLTTLTTLTPAPSTAEEESWRGRPPERAGFVIVRFLLDGDEWWLMMMHDDVDRVERMMMHDDVDRVERERQKKPARGAKNLLQTGEGQWWCMMMLIEMSENALRLQHDDVDRSEISENSTSSART
jgi:hypothetical protein